MALKTFRLFSFTLLLILAFSGIGHATRDITSGKKSSAFDFIRQLQGCHKGYKSEGIHQLKHYLHEFGYLNQNQAKYDNDFDDDLESAVKTYQRNFHIEPTGILDSPTVSKMITPRCGVPDIINGTNYMQSNRKTYESSSKHFVIVSHFSFFPGNPRWPPPKRHLTYRFLSGFPEVAIEPVRRAFQRWAVATQYFTFSEVQTDQSDLTVGFFRGAHGDNSPFDGPGGTLAHAYPPTDGRFHYDADESWSVGPAENSFDLETAATHEIGHLLGLGHSQVEEAIMYPSIASGTTKNIHPDDIQGIRSLYNY